MSLGRADSVAEVHMERITRGWFSPSPAGRIPSTVLWDTVGQLRWARLSDVTSRPDADDDAGTAV